LRRFFVRRFQLYRFALVGKDGTKTIILQFMPDRND